MDSKTKYSGGSRSIYGERSYERWRLPHGAVTSRAPSAWVVAKNAVAWFEQPNGFFSPVVSQHL